MMSHFLSIILTTGLVLAFGPTEFGFTLSFTHDIEMLSKLRSIHIHTMIEVIEIRRGAMVALVDQLFDFQACQGEESQIE